MTFRGHLPLLLLVSLVGTAQAVEFDEKVKAPPVSTAAQLKAGIADLGDNANGSVSRSPAEALGDKALSRQRANARWQLGRLVDRGVAKADMEEMGFTPREDGSFVIDTREHPEWDSLESSLLAFSTPEIVDVYASALASRGFTDGDLAAVKNYVVAHDIKQARAEKQLTLSLSASKIAKKLQRLKKLDDAFMAAYFYQKELALAEADRAWAAGLIESLAPRAQRILVSFISESKGVFFIAPTPSEEAMRFERDLLLRPDYEELAKAAFKEGKL